MDITVVEAPHSTAFTTLARVKREMGIPQSNTSNDERLTDLIEEVSSAIVTFCNQPLIRQTVIERQVGYGRTVQAMSVTPVPRGGLTAVHFREDEVSGCFVSDPPAGFVYNPNRYADTRPMDQWITRTPTNLPGLPDYIFDYTGGYLLPGDDVVLSDCEADSATASFKLVGSDQTFPILVSGERFRVTGFNNAANNGWFTALQRTPTSIIVDRVLVSETASGVVNFECRNLPRDLESAAVFEIKARYLSQYRDPSIKSESLGDWSASYGNTLGTGSAGETGGLNEVTAAQLGRYVRLD
jgi:hypothetical protein